MDENECDYTQKLICGYTGNTGYSRYSCLKLFSVMDHSYVSNPLLCATMITDSLSSDGMSAGYCIANRATELPVLNYNTGVKYAKCNSDNDCSYIYNGYSNYTFAESCVCTPFESSPASYCKYGGGEVDLISDVAYYQTLHENYCTSCFLTLMPSCQTKLRC